MNVLITLDEVRCWCRVDQCIEVTMTAIAAIQYAGVLCVSPAFVLNYAPTGTKVFMWEVSKVVKLHGLCRDSLVVGKNPQQFAYCPISYGEAF